MRNRTQINNLNPNFRNALNFQKKENNLPKILVVTTFPPRECGIATYSQDLIFALNNKFEQSFNIKVCALENETEKHKYSKDVAYKLQTDNPNSYKVLADSINNNSNDDIMTYVLSMNKKNLLVVERPRTEKQPKTQLVSMIFSESSNDTTNDIKPFNIDLPAPTDNILIKNIRLTNGGDIAVLYRLNVKEKIKEKEDVKYQVSRYLAPYFAPIPIEVKYPDVFVTDLALKPDRDGNLLLGGFFSNKNSTQVAGLLFGKIDGTVHEITTLTKQDFKKEFLAQYLTPRQIERGRELADFYLDDLVLRSDGGMLFITEQYYLSSSSYRDIYGFWYNRDLYHYDDVVIFSVSASGDIEWNAVVNKSQSNEDPSELSYLGLIGSEYIYLLYKTRIKGRGMNVYVTRIEYEGKASEPKAFFELTSGNDAFYRSFSEQISNNQAIIVYYSGKTKTFTLAKIEF